MDLCDYGCGEKATYQFKNGKLCCHRNISSCSAIKQKQKNGNTGKIFSIERKINISRSLKGKKRSKEVKEHLRIINMGKLNPHYGKKHKQKTKEIFSILHRLKISQIQNRYPTFFKVEEIRYIPDKLEEKEIQVHCKNHNCKNSKEKTGWFTPTRIQLYERIRQVEKDYGNGGSYFYCSDECKNQCSLFKVQSDPFQKIEKNYTQDEYNQFRNFVLNRDDYICQFCGNQAEHVHHERPQKLEPFFSLDPDYAWSCCSKCHYEKGHKDECSTGKLASIICL